MIRVCTMYVTCLYYYSIVHTRLYHVQTRLYIGLSCSRIPSLDVIPSPAPRSPRVPQRDHGDSDCHFREESLEKVTVLTSKRRKQASRPSKSSIIVTSTRFTEFTEFARLVGRREARGIPARFSRLDWGVLKMAPMANGRHVSFN